jgi:hypothetical protein
MSAAPKWAPHLKLWKFKERRGAQTSINTVTLCRSQFAISRQKNSDLLFFTNRVRQYTMRNKQNGKSKPLVFTADLVISRSDLIWLRKYLSDPKWILWRRNPNWFGLVSDWICTSLIQTEIHQIFARAKCWGEYPCTIHRHWGEYLL